MLYEKRYGENGFGGGFGGSSGRGDGSDCSQGEDPDVDSLLDSGDDSDAEF